MNTCQKIMLLGLVSLSVALPPLRAESAPPNSRWQIAADRGIEWNVSPTDAHRDFIEMSGEQVALVTRYGVNDKGEFSVSHDIIWPMLRFYPNVTGTHLRVNFGEDARFDADARFSPGIAAGNDDQDASPFTPAVFVKMSDEDGWAPAAYRTLRRVYLKGIVRLEGTLGTRLAFRRAIFPSTDKPAVIDTTALTNTSQQDIEFSVDDFQRTFATPADRGVYGAYTVTERLIGAGIYKLKPGESSTFTVVFEAHKNNESLLSLDIAAEERARMSRVDELLDKLRLETPDPVLDTAFAFAKIHAGESIFRTKNGLMHAPGGGMRYYAAVWANDQAEYANPFFGLLGDPTAAESAINAFRHFARFMNPEYRQLPSSIIGEGENFWKGAGDRGDVAMVAYGAGRFALAHGDRTTAEELWPLIEWSLEYLRRKVTGQGVVASDSDELEGRFPAGKANLCTSSLYYDALRSAMLLGGELHKDKALLKDYADRAVVIRAAIERHFGATVEGFETYRYYDKADLADNSRPQLAAYATRPDVLRAWIAIPLTMGIFDRKQGTIDALFSPRLWMEDGLVSEAGKKTYWDRSTLYALRGVLAAGDVTRGMNHLAYYSSRRLLGDHVPYPIEAYPEGDKAQLAAESALYCRVFTEGLFGIRPTGLRSLTVTPQLPDSWPSMALRNIQAFGNVFDLEVKQAGTKRLTVRIIEAGKTQKSYMLAPGESAAVTLH